MSEIICTSGSKTRCSSKVNEDTESTAWIAVFSLTMGVFGLLTAEYLPASLLTPMAAELGVSEALAGQAVTVTAVIAAFSGLLLPVITRNFDRRSVLLGLSALMIASNLLVAISSSLTILLLMRVFLGVALGGFWAMAAAVTMRLVPASVFPRALWIVFSGIAVGSVVAVPLGSYLGGLFGWRSAFLAAAAIGLVTLIFQLLTLPKLPPLTTTAGLRSVLDVVLRPGIAMGMLGCILAHTGHYALFTYIRPFLESTAGVDADGLALLLLGFGVANFAGTLLGGWMMERSLRATLVVMPALVGIAGLSLAFLNVTGPLLALLVAFWGLVFGGVPVAWSTWVARSVPDQAESAGGMVVASVQDAIAVGASAGGFMFGLSGIIGVFVSGSCIMLVAALLIMLCVKMPLAGGRIQIHEVAGYTNGRGVRDAAPELGEKIDVIVIGGLGHVAAIVTCLQV